MAENQTETLNANQNTVARPSSAQSKIDRTVNLNKNHNNKVFIKVDGKTVDSSTTKSLPSDLKVADIRGEKTHRRESSSLDNDLHDSSTGHHVDPIGVWHTSVIHFPIAWLFLLVLVEAFCLLKRQTPRFMPMFRWFVCLAFIPAILTGLVHAGIVDFSPGIDPSTGIRSTFFALPADLNSPENHDLKEHLLGTLLSGLFLSIAVILSSICHRSNCKKQFTTKSTTATSTPLQKLCYIGYCGFLAASLIFLIEGAHHGGELTHGDDVPSCSMR